MSLQMKVAQTPDVAILCQNHRIYLEHAAKIGAKEPEKRIAFRTSAVWKSGEAALEAHGPRTVYLVPGDGGLVEYVAVLEEVLVHPQAGDEATEELLAHCLPETQDQGLWEDHDEQVRTLYVLSHCRWVEKPFPYTELTKLSDGERVDENYSYGYVLVYER